MPTRRALTRVPQTVLLLAWIFSGAASIYFGGVLGNEPIGYAFYAPFLGFAAWWLGTATRSRDTSTTSSTTAPWFGRATGLYAASSTLGLIVYIVAGPQHESAWIVMAPLAVVSVLSTAGALALRKANDEMYWKGTEAARQLTVAWAVLLLWSIGGLFRPSDGPNASLVNTVVAFVLFGVVVFAAGSGWTNYVSARLSIIESEKTPAR